MFVADHGRRRALIRAMIVLGAALIAAWLIALVAGALGWGNLPGVPSLEGSDHGQPAASASQGTPAREQVAAQTQGTLNSANQVDGPSSAGARASSGSGTSAGAGSQQSPGSTGGPPNPGTAAPGNGVGNGPGNGGSAPPSTVPRGSGQPTVTPNGNVPAQDAHGGNPKAPAYGKGGNSNH